MLLRRQGRVPGWFARSLLVGNWCHCGRNVAAWIVECVLAAGSHRVSASTLLRNACKASFAASAFRVQGHFISGGKAMSLDVYFGFAGDLMTATQKGRPDLPRNQERALGLYGGQPTFLANE